MFTAGVMVCAAFSNGHHGQNDPGRIRTHGTVEPVFIIDQQHAVSIGHHVAAALWQADKMPRAVPQLRQVQPRQRVNLHFGNHKIITKHIRHKRQAIGFFNIQDNSAGLSLHCKPPKSHRPRHRVVPCIHKSPASEPGMQGRKGSRSPREWRTGVERRESET
ncbi:hypothetical protein D3C86_1564520 [compost metagenome]